MLYDALGSQRRGNTLGKHQNVKLFRGPHHQFDREPPNWVAGLLLLVHPTGLCQAALHFVSGLPSDGSSQLWASFRWTSMLHCTHVYRGLQQQCFQLCSSKLNFLPKSQHNETDIQHHSTINMLTLAISCWSSCKVDFFHLGRFLSDQVAEPTATQCEFVASSFEWAWHIVQAWECGGMVQAVVLQSLGLLQHHGNGRIIGDINTVISLPLPVRCMLVSNVLDGWAIHLQVESGRREHWWRHKLTLMKWLCSGFRTGVPNNTETVNVRNVENQT